MKEHVGNVVADIVCSDDHYTSVVLSGNTIRDSGARMCMHVCIK